MIPWICNIKAIDEVRANSLISKLGLQDIDEVIRSGRMRLYGLVERSKGRISQVRRLNIDAQKRVGTAKEIRG